MGIVVMLVMAMGAIHCLARFLDPQARGLSALGLNETVVGVLLVGLGLWNALWHGLRFVSYGFWWGGMSIVAGSIMVLAGAALARPWLAARLGQGRLGKTASALGRVGGLLRLVVGLALTVCAIIYLIGIIRLQFA